MSSSTPPLETVCHPLIDCRLDLLDRLLVGSVSRSERLATVGRAAGEIQRLLAAIPTTTPTDDQVLQVLAAIDPPEMVLAAAQSRETATGAGRPPGVFPAAMIWAAPFSRPVSNRAKWACGLGALSLVILMGAPFVYMGVASFEMTTINSEAFVYGILAGYLGFLTLLSMSAVVTSFAAFWRLRRQRGAETGYVWATAGLGMAALPMAATGLAIALLCSAFLFQGTEAGTPADETACESVDALTGGRVGLLPLANPTGDGFNADLSQSPTGENSGFVSIEEESNVVTPASFAVADATSLSSPVPKLPPEPAPAAISSAGTERNPRTDERSGSSTPGGILPLVIQPTVAKPGALFATSFENGPIVDQFIAVEAASPGE